jgi:hypothetical protein
MSLMHFRSVERRRTARAAMSMNVLAYGETGAGEKFRYWTRTTSVSEHGGVLLLEAALPSGQVFELMNEYNMKKASVRVVSLRLGKEGEVRAAIEFVKGGERFWSMAFPAAGTRALRKFRAKAEAGGEN